MSEDYSKNSKYITATGEYLSVSGGNKYYCKDEDYTILHRENDLPAIEYADGIKAWFINGKRHRERDLPAVEYTDGSKEWWLDGKLHREDGPAFEFANRSKEWYLNGEQLPVETQAEFEKYKKLKHFF